jgi:hypothetical protein
VRFRVPSACLGLTFCLLTACSANPAAAPEIGEPGSFSLERTAGGQLLTVQLPSAPFPHPARSHGYQFGNEVFTFSSHYADSSVSVFIPDGYSGRGAVNLVFFFHGWFSTIRDSAQRLDLFRQFAESGADSLLVMPELARNAPDSFGGKFEERGGFSRFVGELLDLLAAQKLVSSRRPGKIVLAAHSGGYRVVSRILERGGMADRIDEVYLFDGLFGEMARYADWIEAGEGRFVSICSSWGQTVENNLALVETLRRAGVTPTVADDDPGEDSEVLQARVLFLSSRRDHYAVVYDRDEFRRLLAASGLNSHL